MARANRTGAWGYWVAGGLVVAFLGVFVWSGQAHALREYMRAALMVFTR